MIHCCSYLGIVAALASEADYVFIPEDPVEIDWKNQLCQKILQVEKTLTCLSQLAFSFD